MKIEKKVHAAAGAGKKAERPAHAQHAAEEQGAGENQLPPVQPVTPDRDPPPECLPPERAGVEAPAPAAAPFCESQKTAEAMIAGLEDRHLRLRADFDNYRRRATREKDEIASVIRKEIMAEFLPVLDDLDSGLKAAIAHNMDKSFTDGYNMILGRIQATLAKLGLVPQDAEGGTFDPAVHEAVQLVPSDDFPSGIIVAVSRKGYFAGERLIRPAQVVVSSGPCEAKPEPPAEGKE